MKSTNMKALIGAAGLAALVGMGVYDYQRNSYELELISSGRCEVKEEAMYYPPPTYVCTSYNKEGACAFQTAIYHDPYMLSHWQCITDDGPEWFWRRKVYD